MVVVVAVVVVVEVVCFTDRGAEEEARGRTKKKED